MPGLGKSGTPRTSSLSGSQLIGWDMQYLPGSFNLKRSERLTFALGQFVFNNGIDAASARTLAQFDAEVFKRLRIACGDDFNLAGIGIAHPAAQAKLCRFAVNEPAKANALHTPANEKVNNHRRV